MLSFVEQNKRLGRKGLQGEAFLHRERMPGAEDRQHFILIQRYGFQSGNGRRVDEAEVHAALLDPLADIGVFPLKQFKLHRRVQLLELFDQKRKPVAADAGEGTDPNHAAFQSFHLAALAAQLIAGIADRPDERKIFLPVGSQGDPAFGTVKKGGAKFLLKGLNHLADGGLGVIKFLCGAGKAACFHDFEKNVVSSQKISPIYK